MSLYRIAILATKELRHGTGNLFFILALVYPIVLSVLVTLVFGDVFDQKPRLGILDEGDSQIVALLEAEPGLDTRSYSSTDALRDDTERGVVSGGIIIPADFDATLAAGQEAQVTRYIWAEAPASDQFIIHSTLQDAYQSVIGVDLPLQLEANQLGDDDVLTWSQRLLPLLVIATIVLGGMLLPASALVDEKVNRTLIALTVTPATLLEVYISKALIGVVISIVMALVVLLINGAFGSDPALLVSVLALGSVSASVFGVILGTFINSVNGLLAVTKGLGLVLFMPAFLAIFPDVPVWTQQVFPTYYIMNPVIEVSQNNASLGDITVDLAVLLALTGAMLIYLVTVFERQQQRLALEN